ncbi:hypothetical protein TWF481_004674 [Arthrobotrys musiformis]|uniref:Pentacotripeptide-repeat region of PRORP domain-containing protein n=1 Tax=Arthrobotrys musiformis TaxID=47236 RepID=A0AAV9WKD7_9PEZI
MYAEVARVHLPTLYLSPPKSRNIRFCSGLLIRPGCASRKVRLGHLPTKQGDDGRPLKTTYQHSGHEAVTKILTKKPRLDFPVHRVHGKPQKIQHPEHWGPPTKATIRNLVASHREKLCGQLLSGGHSPESIATQWCGNRDTIRLSVVGAHLAATGRDRILLRFLEGYLYTAATTTSSRRWPVDLNASAKVLIWCIENIHKRYRSKTISFGSSRSRAERILSILTRMTQSRFWHGSDPIKIGASRARLLLHLLTPGSAFRLCNILLQSKSRVPERILLNALHTLSEAGMFVPALQVFQKLALSPVQNDNSMMLRTWQFRRLFLKLYRAGVPIHKSDVMEFFSSFGLMDPLIYKLLVYAAAGINDANSVTRLTRDYEKQTGVELSLDVMSAVFLMHHRLGDGNKLEITYNDAYRRGLQPLSNSFFVTAVMLVEAHKENASYWELCKLYGRFFKPFALNLLELPLPTQRGWSATQNAPLEPTIGTLTIMLNSYLKTVAGNLEGSRYALSIYKKYIGLLRSDDRIPQFQTASEHFIACIVSAVAKYKPNLGMALGIVQDMIDFGDLPYPTSLTWDSLLRASTFHGDSNTSERIWEAMLEHGIPPTTHTYSAMIMLYATTGDQEKSEILRNRMAREGWALSPHLQHVLDVAERKLKYQVLKGI